MIPAEPIESDPGRLGLSATRAAQGTRVAADTPAAASARRARIEQDEHAADVIRTRYALGLGILIWNGYLVLDAIASRWLEAPPFSFFLCVRLGACAFFIPIWVRLRVGPLPSAWLLTALDTLAYSIASAAIALTTVRFGGLESPYCMGASIILIGATVTRFYQWQIGMWRFGIPALSFVFVLLASSVISPLVRAQFGSPHALALGAVYLTFLITTYAFSVAGGHLVWSLRRQVFETRLVGQYRLKRRIGEGGMGEVWLAYHTALRRDVAVKILLRGGYDGEASLARFEREARATSELTHPNTVRVFDYGTTDDGLWFYAMEYLEGEDFGKLVAREGALPARRAIALISQAARALAEAHERGIIHRDIKPENLLVTRLGGESDFVKVVDFGIAKLQGGDAGGTLTNTGVMLGTPTYISPEAASGSQVDARSDVYGLGAVLYFLLTGAPPFDEKSLPAMLNAHLNTPAPLPSARAPHPVSDELDRIVVTALAKVPADRFADGAAFFSALASCPEARGGSGAV